MKTLLPYQEKAVAWAATKQHFALYMEMRLGKSISSIRTLKLDPTLKYILVLAPKNTLGGWESELAEEGELFFSPFRLNGADPRADRMLEVFIEDPIFNRRRWCLMHYDMVRQIPEINQLKWDAVIFDESTIIKNPVAKISRLCQFGFRAAKRRVLLSGLPNPEGPLNFATQFICMKNTFLTKPNYWAVRAAKFEVQSWSGKWIPKHGVLTEIQHEVMENAFVLKRKDVNVGSKKFYQIRRVELPPDARKIYDETEAAWAFNDDNSGEENSTQWTVVLNTWLRKMAGGFTPEDATFHRAKLNSLRDLIVDELPGEQVVVWYSLNNELKAGHYWMQESGVSSGEIFGETPLAERFAVLDKFKRGELQVIHVQIACARYGIDCSAADTEVYFSNAYSLEGRNQSEDRIVHPTKTTPLLVIDLVAENTIDEDILGALKDKATTSNTLMASFKDRMRRRLYNESK